MQNGDALGTQDSGFLNIKLPPMSKDTRLVHPKYPKSRAVVHNSLQLSAPPFSQEAFTIAPNQQGYI